MSTFSNSFFKLYFFEITVFMKTGDIIYPTSNILVKKSFFNQKIENAAFLCLNCFNIYNWKSN